MRTASHSDASSARGDSTLGRRQINEAGGGCSQGEHPNCSVPQVPNHARDGIQNECRSHSVCHQEKYRRDLMLLTSVTLALSGDDRKVETIDATAMGTSTQLGENVGTKLTIYEYQPVPKCHNHLSILPTKVASCLSYLTVDVKTRPL
jgi:hypothetical protein